MPEDDKEIPSSSSEKNLLEESRREDLYRDTIYGEAISLLRKYLPDAVPQESTEVLFSVFPQYLGKFKGKHYIAAEKIITSSTDLRRLKGQIEAIGTGYVQPQKEPEDWEDPERLLKGPKEYSLDTWREISTLVHELIHQKQAEVSGLSLFELSSPELDGIDIEAISRDKLRRLLREAHRTSHKAVDENSLLYPALEGMATLGDFYVMGRFLDDLMKAGETDIGDKIRQVRNYTFRMEFVNARREVKTGRADPCDLYYSEGVEMMRKLYKQFGIENLPTLLQKIDLNACVGIVKGSAEYEQMIGNPALLPGLR